MATYTEIAALIVQISAVTGSIAGLKAYAFGSARKTNAAVAFVDDKLEMYFDTIVQSINAVRSDLNEACAIAGVASVPAMGPLVGTIEQRMVIANVVVTDIGTAAGLLVGVSETPFEAIADRMAAKGEKANANYNLGIWTGDRVVASLTAWKTELGI